MDNFITIVFAVAMVMFVALSFITGLKRGFRKSIFKLVSVILAIVLAFIFRNFALGLFYSYVDVEAFIVSFAGKEFEGLVSLIIPIVDMLALLLVFVILYGVFSVITLIIYAICSGIGKKKGGILENKLLGALLGVVTGLLVGFVVITPLNEVIRTAGVFVETVEEISPILDQSGTTFDFSAYDYLVTYSESDSCNMLKKTGAPLTNAIARVKDSNGNIVTLDNQIDAIKGLASIASSALVISSIDFDNVKNIDTKDIKDLFKNINDVKDSLSDESIETIVDMFDEVASEMLPELDIDFSNIDIREIDFEKEGDIIVSLIDLGNSENPNYSDVAEQLVKSELAIEVLSGVDTTITVSAEEKTSIKEAVDKMSVEGLTKEEYEQRKTQVYTLFDIQPDKGEAIYG